MTDQFLHEPGDVLSEWPVIPDRHPESSRPTMADEIQDANVVRIARDGDRWLALIGPDPQQGLIGSGRTAAEALRDLAERCYLLGWCFDESWRPRG